jgi:hypothetical protein
MDLAVVVVAEQDQVVEPGRTAFDPVMEVVGVAPASRPFAARPTAVTIANA